MPEPKDTDIIPLVPVQLEPGLTIELGGKYGTPLETPKLTIVSVNSNHLKILYDEPCGGARNVQVREFTIEPEQRITVGRKAPPTDLKVSARLHRVSNIHACIENRGGQIVYINNSSHPDKKTWLGQEAAMMSADTVLIPPRNSLAAKALIHGTKQTEKLSPDQLKLEIASALHPSDLNIEKRIKDQTLEDILRDGLASIKQGNVIAAIAPYAQQLREDPDFPQGLKYLLHLRDLPKIGSTAQHPSLPGH